MIRERAPAPGQRRGNGPSWPTGRPGPAAPDSPSEWAVRGRPPGGWPAAATAAQAPEPEQRGTAGASRLPEAWQGTGAGDGLGRSRRALGRAGGRRGAAEDDRDGPRGRPRRRSARLRRRLDPAPPSGGGRLDPALARRRRPAWDRSILLPLEGPRRGRPGDRGARRPARSRNCSRRALALPGAIAAVLDALEAEARDRPGARAVLAEHSPGSGHSAPPTSARRLRGPPLGPGSGQARGP